MLLYMRGHVWKQSTEEGGEGVRGGWGFFKPKCVGYTFEQQSKSDVDSKGDLVPP